MPGRSGARSQLGGKGPFVELERLRGADSAGARAYATPRWSTELREMNRDSQEAKRGKGEALWTEGRWEGGRKKIFFENPWEGCKARSRLPTSATPELRWVQSPSYPAHGSRPLFVLSGGLFYIPPPRVVGFSRRGLYIPLYSLVISLRPLRSPDPCVSLHSFILVPVFFSFFAFVFFSFCRAALAGGKAPFLPTAPFGIISSCYD